MNLPKLPHGLLVATFLATIHIPNMHAINMDINLSCHASRNIMSTLMFSAGLYMLTHNTLNKGENDKEQNNNKKQPPISQYLHCVKHTVVKHHPKILGALLMLTGMRSLV